MRAREIKTLGLLTIAGLVLAGGQGSTICKSAVCFDESGVTWVRSAQTSARAADLAWLAGTWKGTLGPMQIEERWTPPEGGAMLGVGRTIRQNRMVAFEFLRIVEREGGLVYIAHPGARPGTEFAMTTLDGQSVVFENPQHDHPKIIRYRRTGETLVAEIEGDERGKHVAQTFTFTLTPDAR